MTPARQPHQIFWKDAKPEDFMNAELMDWIQYIGDISTQYELNFIRNFGGVWSAYTSPPAPAPDGYVVVISELEKLAEYFRKHHDPLIAKRGGAIISSISSRPAPPAPVSLPTDLRCPVCGNIELRCGGGNAWCGKCGFFPIEYPTFVQAAKSERERAQPFIDLVKGISLKHQEMVDLMRRNKLKIDDLKDPMQKLAFTFFTEIGEMSHKADVVLKEYEESLRGAQEEQENK